jgi:hypothetical protein
MKHPIYKPNPLAKNHLRNVAISIEIVSGKKLKEVAEKYNISTTTASDAHKKVCRSLYFWLRNSESKEKMELLYHSEFRCEEGIMELNKYKDYLIGSGVLNKNFLDIPPEIRKNSDSILNNLHNLEMRLQRKSENLQGIIEKEFNSIQKILNDIKSIVDFSFLNTGEFNED